MNFISALKADRLITQIRGEVDPASGNAKKALEKLHQIGAAAVPKILQALGATDKRQTVEFVDVLTKLVNEKTLPIILQGLADSNPKTVTGATWALSSSRGYDPNRLVKLLGEDIYSKSAIVDILLAHKNRLSVNNLLAQVYELQPSEKTAVFKIVQDLATETQVPELLARMNGKDPAVKMHLINVVAQFDRDDVQRALQACLTDENKMVRQAALTGLSELKSTTAIEAICALLLDPDVDVINRAIDVIVKLKRPDTINYLLPALKDESEFSRRAAVEVLNEIGTTEDIKHLLEAVADEDWWVQARASDALGRIGGERVVDAVLELIKDKNEDIRRAAIEILNTCNDPRVVELLMQATTDSDWWVSERAADALAELGDIKAVPALLKMLERKDKSVPTALRAIGKLGDKKVLKKLLPFVKSEDKDVKACAMEAVSRLTEPRHAKTIRAYISKHASGEGSTIGKIAADAIQKLDGEGEHLSEVKSTSTEVDKILTGLTATLEKNASVKTSAPKFDFTTLKPDDMIEDRYKFIRKIGKGAFGTVLLVHDTVVDDELILKFLNENVASNEEIMKRFVHELRYSRKITHKNVIRIYDFLSIGSGYAISMEYFPSHTLGQEIIDHAPMNARKAVSYASDVCTGMQIAHHQGIIHRDLKPANILINDDGLLKIVDFGVAAAASSAETQLTKTGYVIGSPKYMAPEQILGRRVDITADVYSLGIVLYEMLSGKPPYSRGDHMSVMYQHVQGKAPPLNELNKQVSKELSSIVLQAMTVDKEKRFKSMDDFRHALEGAVEKAA